MIQPDGVEWKLDGVVDSVPSDKGYKVVDGSSLMSNRMRMTVKVW